ncbi:S-layer homology domain-containing protein [Paenibacillus sp. JX-17]|uniref:S-layer homology domain-containing protein n=1 Tax=Paenibacillus lacisoli TaxID=3064525 RepID=A0ABT9CF09_9BACL|nr:YcdB/YcdC domain-containing protein [Paenibacillus sp. JX-17]MDO7907859.1 S-layer homology domain-containing protein [Paenibacillus sp. JX-17]
MNTRRHSMYTKVTAAALVAMLLYAQAPLNGTVQAASGAGGQTEAGGSQSQSGESQSAVRMSLAQVNDSIPKGAKLSSRQALQKILDLMPALSNVKVNQAEYGNSHSYPSGYEKYWDISFAYEEVNSSYGFGAKVDGVTGDIINVYLPDPIADKIVPAGNQRIMTRAEAAEKAQQFALKANPGMTGDQLQESEGQIQPNTALLGKSQYYFNYDVKINGLPSSNETINIMVSKTGSVTSYSRSMSHAAYPSAEPAISADKAKELLVHRLELVPAYLPDQLYGSTKKTYSLSYVPRPETLGPLDAVTGKWIDTGSGTALAGPLHREVKGSGQAFAAKRIQSEQDAVQRVKAAFGIPQGWSLERASRDEDRLQGRTVWSVNFTQEGQSRFIGFPDSIWVMVDESNGQIMSYSWSQPSQSGSPTGKKALPAQQLDQKAVQLVYQTVPNASKEWKMEGVVPTGTDGGYRYNFQRYVNEMLVVGDTVSLTLAKDGAVQSFYSSAGASAAEFPASSKPVRSAAEAKDILISKLSMQLSYSRIGGFSSASGADLPESNKLTYIPQWDKQPLSYYTGVRDAAGNIVNAMDNRKAAGQAKDIQGHAAEKALQTLLEYRVITPDQDGSVHPDDTLTRGDWYTLVAKALNPDMVNTISSANPTLFADVKQDSPYYNSIASLVSYQYLKIDPAAQLHPEAALTRDELALELARYLHYDKLTAFFNTDQDVKVNDAASIKNKGAVMLSLRLNLLSAEGGNFKPLEKMTLAQAAEVLTQLVELEGQTDTSRNERY